VELRSTLDPGIWCCGDANQMAQVVMNLGMNAIQAMEGRTGSIEVTLSGVSPLGDSPEEALSHYAVLEVKDQGKGIPPEVLPRVFEPFFTTKPEGTGVGLAVTRRIVQAHGGGIWFNSPPGEGCRATVMLPALLGESRLNPVD